MFLTIFTSLSFAALIYATLAERTAILSRINGANGLIITVFLVVSFHASMVVVAISGFVGGWGYLWRVLVGTVVYHKVMAVATIGYLHWLATRTKSDFQAREVVAKLANMVRFSKKKP